jgi:hypothetical protein
MSDYVNHLFSYLPPERLGTFSYGHVIPHTNLVAQSLTQGLLGSEFDFTYEKRNSEKMVRILQPWIPSDFVNFALGHRSWTHLGSPVPNNS